MQVKFAVYVVTFPKRELRSANLRFWLVLAKALEKTAKKPAFSLKSSEVPQRGAFFPAVLGMGILLPYPFIIQYGVRVEFD
jgi:hypothetical protein